MFALRFRFPMGRYHATPWGRHVNEGAVAWPPEPWRILRALIATHYRKPPTAGADEPRLATLIDVLAEELPAFILPEAVHAHTRHYMPQGALSEGREKSALVFDAFYRLKNNAEIVAVWLNLDMPDALFDYAAALAAHIGYLGRAESIADVRADCACLELAEAIREGRCAQPLKATTDAVVGREVSDVIAPLSPSDYAAALPRLREQTMHLPLSTRKRADLCLPETLLQALQIDSGVLREAGWSRPPASRIVAYAHPKVGVVPPPKRVAQKSTRAKPTTLRFMLAGSPAPQITETLPIAEVFRSALMARFSNLGGARAPQVLSGRDEQGAPLRNGKHGHAFFLPEDADGDGRLDHLILHAADGLDDDVVAACAGLQRLWLDQFGVAQDQETDRGRREWKVALIKVGAAVEFAAESRVLGRSRMWHSVTPYLRPWHVAHGKPDWAAAAAQLRREVSLREMGDISSVEPGPEDGRITAMHRRNVLHFKRFRSRRGLTQPDRSGRSLQIAFEQPVQGPLAFGFGAHFGLGLFESIGP